MDTLHVEIKLGMRIIDIDLLIYCKRRTVYICHNISAA